VVGAGPAGMFCAAHLLRSDQPIVAVDVFDRLPTPFGLVRFGVAPDHPKIKRVATAFRRTLDDPRCRFQGNVELGRDLHASDLAAAYDAVVWSTGSQRARRLDIPGEDLVGVHDASAFARWYNGHPDHANDRYALDGTVVVVGNGNVALDVSRVMARADEELSDTGISPLARTALAVGKRDILVLGRRGPEAVRFTQHELTELADLADAGVEVVGATLDPGQFEHPTWRSQVLADLVERSAPQPRHRHRIRFAFHSQPLRLHGETSLESVDVGMVDERTGQRRVWNVPTRTLLRAVGEDAALPTTVLGFTASADDLGRLTTPDLPGRHYVSGWLRRGPTGIVGTSKRDAVEVVNTLLDDVRAGPRTRVMSAQAWGDVLRSRVPALVDEHAWQRIAMVEDGPGSTRSMLVRWDDLLSTAGVTETVEVGR
jgi:ferredoxin--NADP+ reductase